VMMALRGFMPHTPFGCPRLSSEGKIISMQDNLSERQPVRKPEPPGQASRPGEPTGRVGQLLFVAQQTAQTLATERLEPLGLSPRAWGVLSTLAESGPLTQIELATAMSIDRTAMVYLLDELEEQSLVERVRHPRDRRAFLIHLTAAGREMQRRAAAALAGAADTLLAPLDPAEREQLINLLGQVAAHWQRVAAVQRDVAAVQRDPGAGEAGMPAARAQPARPRKRGTRSANRLA
jgi:DNA-binding MarR family transcriptional regulator